MMSANLNEITCFEVLLNQGSEIYTCCRHLNNILHYAVLNKNKQMIQMIVFADAESDRLLGERNYRNQTPYMLDFHGDYQNIFNHIWSAASQQSQAANDHLSYILESNIYNANQKTLVGKNTALHFAVLNENLKAIEILCNQIDIKITERNIMGQTPMDIALLIPKKTLSMKIV